MHYISFRSISECLNLLIVVFESINCPQYDFEIHLFIRSLSERVQLQNQICKSCWKTEKSAEQIFLKNSGPFNCSEQTRDSWTTITKQKKLWINQGTTHSIKNHIEWGYFNHFNYFWSCRLHVNIFDVRYLTQDSTDLSYFVKIFTFSQIL